MIFQDPFACLHPMYRVGSQIAEAVRAHVERLQGAGLRARRRGARRRRHPERPSARQGLPAPVLGRHAPARDDRDGARAQPVRADRRRAHDGARRDGAGADPRADRQGQARLRHRRDPGHPRPRRRRRDGADRHGHVRRAAPSSTGRRAEVFDARSTPTRGGCSSRCRASRRKVAHLRAIEGSPPSVIHLPPGCAFHPRCPHRFEPCHKVRPPLEQMEGGHARRLPSRHRRRSDGCGPSARPRGSGVGA